MPGVANPAGVTVSYGSGDDKYTFPVTMEPLDVHLSPVYDRADRSVVAVTHRLRVTATVYPEGDEADASGQMAALRRRLSVPAAELNVVGHGFGDLTVNRPGGPVWDMAMGPKPRLIACTQVGSALAWRVVWQVETTIPEKCPEESDEKRLMEWNYSVSWSVNERGLTTRTVQGLARVPLTRRKAADRTIDFSADELREQAAGFPPVPGFRRTPGQFRLSDDRRTLEFTVQDVQLESPHSPPPGVVLVSMSHDMRTMSPKNLFQFAHSVQARYTCALGADKRIAWEHFREAFLARWAFSRARKFLLVPLVLSLRNDDLYGMSSSYAITYALTINAPAAGGAVGAAVGPDPIEESVNSSGLFLPPPRAGWEEWSESMKNVWGVRGLARMRYDAADDRVIDVCNEVKTRELSPGDIPAVPDIGDFGGGPRRVRVGAGGGSRMPRVKIPPEESWLSYRSRFRIIPVDSRAAFKLLPPDGSPPRYRPPEPGPHSTEGYRADYAPPRQPQHALQLRAEPTYYLEWSGEAARAGWAIDPPRVTAAGGSRAYAVNDASSYFETEVEANLMTPVVAARWRFLYVLEDTPGRPIFPPANPMLGSVQGGGAGGQGLGGFAVSR